MSDINFQRFIGWLEGTLSIVIYDWQADFIRTYMGDLLEDGK